MNPQRDHREAFDLIDQLVEGQLSETDATRLDQLVATNPDARRYYIEHVALVSDLQSHLAASASDEPPPVALPIRRWHHRLLPFAAAAALACIAVIWAVHSRQQQVHLPVASTGSAVEAPRLPEPTAEGFAFVRHLVDAELYNGARRVNVGDSVSGRIELKKGHAQIDFFCGASAIVEAPAVIDVVSAWEAFCGKGKMQVRVPPAAEGFIVKTSSSQIRDLGTEFSLDASETSDRVSVIEGKVSLSAGKSQPVDVTQGQAMLIPRDRPEQATRTETVGWIAPQLGDQSRQATQDSLARWQQFRVGLRHDPRLIAYYDFDGAAAASAPEDVLPDLAIPAQPKRDGAIIAAKRVQDRWGIPESALEFKQPGSRVRVMLPGDYDAFTFSCWVRIDSLDRWYNALFMVDGFKKGQPHWQIRDDGRLMLGVLIDEHWSGSPDGRRNYNYLSPPLWTMAQSGQWIHLASVYSPAGRYCAHFLNGKEISREKISDDNYVPALRIGAAEIGNWGQPFRDDPKFAIRSFNGCIDELAVFGAALAPAEIEAIYRQSRPAGW